MDAAECLWAQLTERGFALSAKGDVLYVNPGQALTADDYAAIRANKPDLLKLVRERGLEQTAPGSLAVEATSENPPGPDQCPNCYRPLDPIGCCWRCCNRRCNDCGGMTGSAFILLCMTCEYAAKQKGIL